MLSTFNAISFCCSLVPIAIGSDSIVAALAGVLSFAIFSGGDDATVPSKNNNESSKVNTASVTSEQLKNLENSKNQKSQNPNIAQTDEHDHNHDDVDIHDHDHDHEHHHHHSHSHHSGINSFVIETDKPLVLANINEWLNELVYIYGPELYRYKGILNVEGLDYQIIFQGVQMSFDISRGRDWNDTKRGSTLVFIGKNLPENQLRESFIACTEK